MAYARIWRYVEEYRTVGIGVGPSGVTENDIRAEQGVPLCGAYSYVPENVILSRSKVVVNNTKRHHK